MLSKNGKNIDAALKIADYWMSPEGSTFLVKNTGSFPINKKADVSFLEPIKVDMKKNIESNNYRLVNRFWEATPTELMLLINQKFAEFIYKPNTDKIPEEIQKLADDYWQKK
jgi:ABC-type glycerol-3-phosphate transport system substrate-binding protein